MSILIIAEKPSVAERIASSFGNASKLRNGKVPQPFLFGKARTEKNFKFKFLKCQF